jgi:hypothetical protein
LKLFEESIGKNLGDIDIDNTFLNRTPIAQIIRARINKLDFIKSRDNLQTGRKCLPTIQQVKD